jgi:hypothetical protein
MRKCFFVFAFLCLSLPLLSQQALNNDAVIKLTKAGLSEDLIVSTINSQPGSYNTTTDGLIALKSAGVSDKVVSAIVMKASAPTAVPAPIPPPDAVPAQTPSVPSTPFHSADGKIRIYVTDNPIFESTGIARATSHSSGSASMSGSGGPGGSSMTASAQGHSDSSAGGVTHTQQGDDPRTVEIQADIVKVCPAFMMVSNNPDRADYILVFRRQGGKRSSFFAFGGLAGLALSATSKVDGASLFLQNGDMVYATKQNTVEKAIKDSCDHIPAPQQSSQPLQISTPAKP